MGSVSCPSCLTLVRNPGSGGFRGFLACPSCGNRFLATFEEDPLAAVRNQMTATTAAIPAAEIAEMLSQQPPEDLSAEATREGTGRTDSDLAPRVQARLRLLGSNRIMPLEKFKFTIGRSGSDLAVDDPAISRQHAVIENHSEKFLLKDLGSTNGTYLNGKRVTIEFLQTGDVIQAGKIKLRFESRP